MGDARLSRYPSGCGALLPSADRGHRTVVWCVPCQARSGPADWREVIEVVAQPLKTVGGDGSSSEGCFVRAPVWVAAESRVAGMWGSEWTGGGHCVIVSFHSQPIFSVFTTYA